MLVQCLVDGLTNTQFQDTLSLMTYLCTLLGTHKGHTIVRNHHWRMAVLQYNMASHHIHKSLPFSYFHFTCAVSPSLPVLAGSSQTINLPYLFSMPSQTPFNQNNTFFIRTLHLFSILCFQYCKPEPSPPRWITLEFCSRWLSSHKENCLAVQTDVIPIYCGQPQQPSVIISNPSFCP